MVWDILIDIYLHPKFSDDIIEKEKKVIIEEYNNIMDRPSSKLRNLYHERLFKNTSLEIPVIGLLDNIKKSFKKRRK